MYLALKQQSILDEDTGVLYFSRGVHSLRLNQDAVSIVKAIASTGSYDNAIASVACDFAGESASPQQVKPGFDAFLAFLDTEGFLIRSATPVVTNFRIIRKVPIRRLFVELLSGCNLTCSHCYAHHAAKSHHLRDTDRLMDHMKEAIEYGIHKVDLSGGEVFIFPQLREILTLLTSLNTPVNLYSNLTMLQEEHFNFLTQQSIASVITSIDALTPEIHDRFRGMAGAWRKTIDNVKKLIDLGLPVRINIIPTNETLPEIKALCDFLYNKVGVTNIVIGTLFNVGRQNESRIEHVAQKAISELVAKINVDVFGRDLSVWEKNNVQSFADVSRPGCGVGYDMLFLSSWGEYAYCPILTSRESTQFAIGDFYSSSFSQIAERFLEITSTPSCSNVGNCSYGKVCQSGCRARAFHNTGDLTARDSTRCDFWSALDTKKTV